MRRDAVIGRTTAVSVRPGVLLESHLAPVGTASGLPGMIPLGMRGFTIHTPSVASGLAGLVHPGDRVDVLLTINSDKLNEETGGSSTVTMLRNIEVLAVDQEYDDLRSKTKQPAAKGHRSRKAIKSVTLLTTPKQALRLGLGQSNGTLQLALRNPRATEDDDGPNTPVTLADLLGADQLKFVKEKLIPEPVITEPVPTTEVRKAVKSRDYEPTAAPIIVIYRGRHKVHDPYWVPPRQPKTPESEYAFQQPRIPKTHGGQ